MHAMNIIEEYKTGRRDFVNANLRDANLRDADLRYADLRDADLRDADLRYADLRYADLQYADLRYADLRYADLRYANLRDADLRGANLRYANLGSGCWIIQGPCRSDGYWFFFQKLHGETVPLVKAGCRYFTVKQAFEHWTETCGGTKLGDETMEILHSMWSIAYHRGYIDEDGTVK